MSKPTEGGSYVRLPDGSLERAEATAPAIATTATTAVEDKTTPASARASGKARAMRES